MIEGGEEQKGAIVVTGSHDGLSAARYALAYRPLLVVSNDAGIGKDEAGVAGIGHSRRPAPPPPCIAPRPESARPGTTGKAARSAERTPRPGAWAKAGPKAS